MMLHSLPSVNEKLTGENPLATLNIGEITPRRAENGYNLGHAGGSCPLQQRSCAIQKTTTVAVFALFLSLPRLAPAQVSVDFTVNIGAPPPLVFVQPPQLVASLRF